MLNTDNRPEIDPRKAALKRGLRQLSIEQLRRVIDYEGDMVLDHCNYDDGMFCPLAVGLGIDKIMHDPTDAKVTIVLTTLGYDIYNTRGVPGEFYQHPNRLRDLLEVAREIVQEYVDSIPNIDNPEYRTNA